MCLTNCRDVVTSHALVTSLCYYWILATLSWTVPLLYRRGISSRRGGKYERIGCCVRKLQIAVCSSSQADRFHASLVLDRSLLGSLDGKHAFESNRGMLGRLVMFVNIEKAEATVESDRLRIIGEVRDTVGIDRLNSIIRDQCRWPVVLASFLVRWQIQLRDLVVCPHRCVRFLRLLWGTRHYSSFYEREAWCVIIRADAVRPVRRC